MTDREVRQIKPEPSSHEGPLGRTFADYQDRANIVLLGDPGAGKSYLFDEFASAFGGTFVTTRDFLNIPSFPENAVLFIDGLDERRAGRQDQSTMDAVVTKLFAVAPSKVRISCRAQDWLGDTDLAAFRPYFDGHGGTTVLALGTLSSEEQRRVLNDTGVTNPGAFLDEARERGLAEFLENPQNLILLYKAVTGGKWPASRAELFRLSTDLLLSEPNAVRARTGVGIFSVDELRNAAGVLCALRLISDVAGISLSEQSIEPDFPSYRTTGYPDLDKVQAALGRRVFRSGAVAETVEYAHRTTAEYLAAAWLADRIRAGLPLGRIQALLGVDGHPSSELRGLHAWLAVLSPVSANQLIDGDPYGVLTYGDAGALAPSTRRSLLAALARLSETDPWFREGSWSSVALGPLSRPDMVGPFREVLRSGRANFVLRSIVLDALSAGMPLPELKEELLLLLWQIEAPFAERNDAFSALARMGADAKAAIVDSFRSNPNSGASDLRLRSRILGELYKEGAFRPFDIVELLENALACEEELPGGALWSLRDEVPLVDIPEVLDSFSARQEAAGQAANSRNTWEVARAFDRLLLRTLENPQSGLTGKRVLGWLRSRHALRDADHDNLQKALRESPRVLRDTAYAFVGSVTSEESLWMQLYEFEDATLHAVQPDDLLDAAVDRMANEPKDSREERMLYELSLSCCVSGTSRAATAFQELFGYAAGRPRLEEVRAARLSCLIPERHLERQAARAERKAEELAGREENIRKFSEHAASIRSGSHLGWLTWAAKIYSGRFSDSDKAATSVERLVGLLGEANAITAIEGFIAITHRDDIPTLSKVAETAADHSVFEWWYAMIAGLDERWKVTPQLNAFSSELLLAALAIELTNPSFDEDEGSSHRAEHGWKIVVMQERPELARDAYLTVARAQLSRHGESVDGLYALLNDEPLRPFRRRVALDLLADFPNVSHFRLEELLRSALAEKEANPELLTIARKALAPESVIGEDQHNLWLAAAYLASPDEFSQRLDASVMERPGVVCALRDFAGYERERENSLPPILSLTQREFIARAAGRRFSNVPHPNVGWSGDTNEWDVAQFVRTLVDQISNNASDAATVALERLSRDPELASYRDHIRHALANQHTRKREAEYRQPDWKQTVATLANTTPANVPDLHALLLSHFRDIQRQITGANTDIFKRFWNEDPYGRPVSPKPEESARDALVDLVKPRMTPLGVVVEPEGHMVADKRADISVALSSRKVLVELKRDRHSAVWNSIEAQLDRFYTIDAEATGYGVYGVFWYAEPSLVPAPPDGAARPQSAAEMEQMLLARLAPEKRSRIAIVVLDVSGDR